MMHDDFEAWVRHRCSACLEPHQIDKLCSGELDIDSGDYTFEDNVTQAQWEAWQASKEFLQAIGRVNRQSLSLEQSSEGRGTITFEDTGYGEVNVTVAFDPPLDVENDKATPAQYMLMEKWKALIENDD